ncbi:hypothetical protein TGMAS_327500 [Toxoplasma gondii MAS]|uniref:Uncharacterized protein n=1 Tax=Toxoplasma gondii MAS TaxID=943118 RepID=A0A086PWX0_TOXGO|nr:hypothetical protein TGMAS_327500 [Toxoplasma gondii MAS]
MKNSGESSRAADCVSDEGTGCAAAASRGEAGGFCSDAFPVISSSDAGDALLGCQAAKDLVQALLWMKKTHNVSTVSIYAQGVSAMGTMLLVRLVDLNREREENSGDMRRETGGERRSKRHR